MEYISVKEAALRWGIDPSRIGKLARAGRIDGARIVGRNWLIPADAQKPCDKRQRQNKQPQERDSFRFPLFINQSKEYEFSPLSKEETELQAAQKEFISCRFSPAAEKFAYLCHSTENRYVRICSLFFMCLLSMEYDASIHWDEYYAKFQSELAEDFPYKKEMELFSVLLYVYGADLQSAAIHLTIDPEYVYHPSCHYLCMYLTFFSLVKVKNEEDPTPYLGIYELLSQKMESDGYYYEAQELHRILFAASLTHQDKKRALYHLKKLLCIAHEHGFLFAAADLAPYYASIFHQVLCEFPAEFAKKIMKYANPIYQNFVRFTEKYKTTDIFTSLSKKDYQLLLYVYGGYSNREISGFMGISEHTVANNLAAVYEKLGLAGKKELQEYISRTLQFHKE